LPFEPTPPLFDAPLGETLLEFRTALCDPMFSRFGTIPGCNGRTDRETDDTIYCASISLCGNKNLVEFTYIDTSPSMSPMATSSRDG